MNLGALRSAIERRTGIAFDSVALTDIINEALQAVSSEASWPWLEQTSTFSTVANTGVYALPADDARVRSVTLNGDEVQQGSIRSFDADPGAHGWAVYGGQLVLAPTPLGTYSVVVRYVGTEPALVLDADTPLLPSRFHGAIVEYAAATVLERTGSGSVYRGFITGGAGIHWVLYDKWLTRIRKGAHTTSGPRRIRVREGGVFGS